MPKLLVGVDGSAASLRCIDHMVNVLNWFKAPVELHLLNVQHPLRHDVSRFVASGDVKGFHHDQGLEELAAARAALDLAGVAYVVHVGVGEDIAETILHYAREKAIDQIVLGSNGRSAVGEFLLGSVSREVLKQAAIPVLIVK